MSSQSKLGLFTHPIYPLHGTKKKGSFLLLRSIRDSASETINYHKDSAIYQQIVARTIHCPS